MRESGVTDKTRYSYFEQIAVSKPIKEISKTDPDIVPKIVKKIKNNTIQKAESIRKIGAIYKNKEARKRAFGDNEVLEDVYIDLKAKAPMTDSTIMKNTDDLLKRVQTLTRAEREAIKTNNRDKSRIEYLTKELISLCSEMDIKIHIPKKIRVDSSKQ